MTNYSRKKLPSTKSTKPGKQRRSQIHAPKHRIRRMMSCRISDDISQDRYYPRSIPVVKGDTVKVMRGEYRGLKKKVNKVDRKKRRVYVEGAVYTKADGTKIPRPIHPSNLIITDLDRTDARRMAIISRARKAFNIRHGESPDKDYSEPVVESEPELPEDEEQEISTGDEPVTESMDESVESTEESDAESEPVTDSVDEGTPDSEPGEEPEPTESPEPIEEPEPTEEPKEAQ